MQWRPMTLDLVRNVWPRRKSAARRDTLAPYFRHGFWGRNKFLTGLVIALIGALYGFIFGLTQTYYLVEMLIPAAIVAFISICLLPENGKAHQRTITFLFFAFITVLAVWPDYLALTLPGLPWVTAIRLVGMPLSLVFFVSLSQSKVYRTSLKSVLSDSGLVWPFLLTYFVLAAVTLPLSATPTISLNKFIVSLYSWLAICLVAICVFQVPGKVRQFAQLLWATTVISCLVGLQEYRLSAVPWAGHIPSFLAIEDPTIARILSGVVRAALGEHRVQGKFTTPLSFAEFLALVIPFLIHFMMTGRGYSEQHCRCSDYSTRDIHNYCYRLAPGCDRVDTDGVWISVFLGTQPVEARKEVDPGTLYCDRLSGDVGSIHTFNVFRWTTSQCGVG